jgi:hypothetical protein
MSKFLELRSIKSTASFSFKLFYYYLSYYLTNNWVVLFKIIDDRCNKKLTHSNKKE